MFFFNFRMLYKYFHFRMCNFEWPTLLYSCSITSTNSFPEVQNSLTTGVMIAMASFLSCASISYHLPMLLLKYAYIYSFPCSFFIYTVSQLPFFLAIPKAPSTCKFYNITTHALPHLVASFLLPFSMPAEIRSRRMYSKAIFWIVSSYPFPLPFQRWTRRNFLQSLNFVMNMA